ncbi:hypothetical protein K1T71_012091 [Dendrolimus kikuchii]|uniref:Uncharacterized protein n=1 Tax=Dendrolimus kikuchii TaxID=765133 RepID=A0ACC1CKJ6_9NEOP|nr:hypothetical protein K1T71_012091 [Dendrolimus kikuchii]
MVLTLYKKDSSPPCRSVRMVLFALGIDDVKLIDVNLPEKEHLKEDYLKINPQHTVPTLIDDDLIIWDSHAIATYLVTVYGKDDSLYPKDPKKRAIVDQRLHFDSSILFASLRATVEPVIYHGEKAYRPENLARLASAYEFVEKFLSSAWLAGNQPTVADICCVSSLSSMNEVLPIDRKLHPKLTDWLNRCSQQEFYIKGNLPGIEKFKELMKSKLG